MSRNSSTSSHLSIEVNRANDLPRALSPSPPQHLTLVVDRDRQIDPVPLLAAVGPSNDF